MSCLYAAAVAFPSYMVKLDASAEAMTDIASVGVSAVGVVGIDTSPVVEALIAAAARLVSSAQA